MDKTILPNNLLIKGDNHGTYIMMLLRGSHENIIKELSMLSIRK